MVSTIGVRNATEHISKKSQKSFVLYAIKKRRLTSELREPQFVLVVTQKGMSENVICVGKQGLLVALRAVKPSVKNVWIALTQRPVVFVGK